jgi:hypothetical protein
MSGDLSEFGSVRRMPTPTPSTTSAFEALSATMRPHAERWAIRLLDVPDDQVARILERLLRDVLDEVDSESARDNLDEVKEWLRLVGHAVVERRHELRMRGGGAVGRA